MALKKEIENLLTEWKAKGMSDEDVATLRATYDKNPAIQDVIINEQMKAQSDYSRTIQDAKKTETEAKALLKKNQDWFRDSEADFTRLEAANKKLEADLAAAKTARPKPEDGATQVDMTKYDTALDEMRTQLAASKKALEDSQEQVAKRFDAGGMWIFEVENAAEKYRSEYGKPLDRVAFTKFMSENNMMDPQKALETYSVADSRAKWEADKLAEITKTVEAKYSANGRMPYDNGTSVLEQGPLKRFISPQEGDVKIPAGITADGSGRLASLAGQELRSEGKV